MRVVMPIPFRRTVLVLAFAVSWAAVSVAAQSDGTLIEDNRGAEPAFAIAPVGEVEGAYFAVTMEPGDEQMLTAALVNANTAAFPARTFAADAYTIVNGGMGVREDGSEATGVTTWVDYPAETLTLEPSSTIERTFTVTVPDGTAPGQYLTGIVLQTAEPLPVSGSTTFDQILRKSVAVFITVPGPVEAGLAVGAVSVVQGEAWSALVVEVANTGNVLVRPTGSVVLRDASGATVLSAPVAMGPVYAGHATTIELLVDEQLAPGAYDVELDLGDETHEVTSSAREAVTVSGPETAEKPAPLTITDVALTPTPSVAGIQFLDVAVDVANAGPPIVNARLVLHVVRDGEPVEAFSLATSLGLPSGTTGVQQRYVPAGGWGPGTYSFGLTLETVDPSNGVVRVIAESEIDGTVSVP